MLYVQSRTPDDGRKDCPKHVEWYSINSKNCASGWFYYKNRNLCDMLQDCKHSAVCTCKFPLWLKKCLDGFSHTLWVRMFSSVHTHITFRWPESPKTFVTVLYIHTHLLASQTYYNANLMFVGPCIVIYFYSKTNQMHNISNLLYFGTTLYMFRMVSPSIIRSLKTVHTASYHTGCVAACEQSATQPVWYVAVCTVLDSWWWTERPSETCRVLFQNIINLKYCASGWFYYRNKKY
jgi:hypothetical protein